MWEKPDEGLAIKTRPTVLHEAASVPASAKSSMPLYLWLNLHWSATSTLTTSYIHRSGFYTEPFGLLNHVETS